MSQGHSEHNPGGNYAAWTLVPKSGQFLMYLPDPGHGAGLEMPAWELMIQGQYEQEGDHYCYQKTRHPIVLSLLQLCNPRTHWSTQRLFEERSTILRSPRLFLHGGKGHGWTFLVAICSVHLQASMDSPASWATVLMEPWKPYSLQCLGTALWVPSAHLEGRHLEGHLFDSLLKSC